jgi:hypothetical protein
VTASPDGCGGHLVYGTCLSCGGRRGVHEPPRFHRQRFAMWGPVTEAGRCAHADVVRAEEEREGERQARSGSTGEVGRRSR